MSKGLYNGQKWLGVNGGDTILSVDPCEFDIIHDGVELYPSVRPNATGIWSDDFFNLSHIEIGNTQGTTENHKPHITYKSIMLDDVKLFDDNTICDGTNRISTETDIDWSKQTLSIILDMNACLATSSGEDAMETVMGIGDGISEWSRFKTQLFFYGYKSGDKCYLVVQFLDKNYKNETHRRIIHIENGIATIKISMRSVIVNDQELYHDVNLKAKQTGYNLGDSITISSNDCGSYIDSIILRKVISSVQAVDVVDPGINKQGERFSKDFGTSLDGLLVQTELNLDTYTTGTQNVLSVGTNISLWGEKGEHNIHIYYNGSMLQFDAIDIDHKAVEYRKTYAMAGGTVQISINSNGVSYVRDDTTVQVYDTSNTIINYLVSNSGFQVGSMEGGVGSTVTYNYLKVSGNSFTTSDTKLIDGMQTESFTTEQKDIDFISGDSIIINIQPQNVVKTLFTITGNQHSISVRWITDGVLHINYDNGYWLEQTIPTSSSYRFSYSRSSGLIVNDTILYFDVIIPYIPYFTDKENTPVYFQRGIYGGLLLDKNGRILIGNDKMLGQYHLYIGKDSKWLGYANGKVRMIDDKYDLQNGIIIRDQLFGDKMMYGRNRLDYVTSTKYKEPDNWVIKSF